MTDAEQKRIAKELLERGVINAEQARILGRSAGEVLEEWNERLAVGSADQTEPRCEFCGSRFCTDLAGCAEAFLEKTSRAELAVRNQRRLVRAQRFKLVCKVAVALAGVALLGAACNSCEQASAERYRKARENWRSWSAAFLGDRKAVCTEAEQMRTGLSDEAYSCIIGRGDGRDNHRIVCHADGCQRWP